MNPFFSLISRIGILTLALAATSAEPLFAQQKVAPDDASKHFEEVAKHLELGGAFFGYMDVDGDVQQLGTLIDGMLSVVRDQGQGGIPEKLTAAGIINELGLDSIKAIGLSSRKAGPELYHNLAFLATPDGPKGIFKMLGGKAAPFLATKLAPKGADLVIEQDLNVSVLLDIVKNILAQMGDQSAQEQLDRSLEQPMKPLEITVADFIKKLNTKVTLFAQLHPEKKLQIDGLADPIPFIDAVLAIDKMGWLFAEIKKVAAEQKEMELGSGDGFETITMIKPLPDAFAEYKPVLYHDKKTDRIFLTSRPEYLKLCLEGKETLAADEEYKKAMVGLPTEGNGLSYMSAKSLTQLWNLLKLAFKNEPEAQQQMLLKFYELYLPKNGVAMADVRANLDRGLLFASNSSESHKSTVLTAAVYPIAMAAAVGAPMMRRMQQRQMELGGAEAAPAPSFPLDDEKMMPEEKVKSNLQQVAFAAEAYFLDHDKDKEVTYAQLVKGGFLFEVDPVKGESYKDLTLKRAGGKMTLKLSSGEEVTHEYPAVTD